MGAQAQIVVFFESRRGRKKEKKGEKEGKAVRRERRRRENEDKEGERNTSGHEGERQIKFDHKLHEIVGEPRWSVSVL